MKNIVRFTITKPNGSITIDAQNPEFKYNDFDSVIAECIPLTKIFERIIVKNFYSIQSSLLNRLTNQYLHGAEIIFTTPTKKFEKAYLVKSPRAFYSYQWTPLDLSKPVPKSLANFTFDYKGKQTTYLDAISTLNSTRYLPNEIWNALDIYSRQQIDKCREYNKGNYSLAELWFKELMKDCSKSNIKVYSPNKKTYFEAMAELTFEKECEDMHLPAGLRPLNPAELCFLHKYASAYGVEIPTFQFRFNSRKTDDGYTQEPERVLNGMSNSDWSKVIYDCRNTNNLPKFVRQGLTVQSCESNKLLRDAYYQLKWIMKHLKDDGLMPGYKRCPVCHKIYREHDGCECGACQAIEFIQADNLLYGISSSYEDYDSTKNAYDELDPMEY